MPDYLPLSSLFDALSRLKQSYTITEFDVTRATLEQVFQTFARKQAGRNKFEPGQIFENVKKRRIARNKIHSEELEYYDPIVYLD